MKVHHLNCGTLCPFGGRLVSGAGSVLERGRLVCHCLLVESGAGLVLVDTGLGRADVERPGARLSRIFRTAAQPILRLEETAIAQVEALGFRADDVRHIVVTHLDPDHAGGLSDFPRAKVHIFEPEHGAATHPSTAGERARYHAIQWSHGPEWVVHPRAGERWFGFDSIRMIDEVGDDLLLIPLEGHSRGHAGVAVRSGERWLLHAGDAFFFREQVAERPWIPIGLSTFQRAVDHDYDKRMKNQEMLRLLVRDRHEVVEVFCAHDPESFAALATRA